ncbi:hypothetical protein [Thermococcus sp.]
MFNVTRNARGNKRLTAMAFAFSVVALVFVGFVVAVHSTATYNLTLAPNVPSYLLIRGSFLTISIHVSASTPVTVCITDSSGLERLKDGEEALCYLYAKGITNMKKVWRSPGEGPFYLVIVSDKPSEVALSIDRGFIVR